MSVLALRISAFFSAFSVLSAFAFRVLQRFSVLCVLCVLCVYRCRRLAIWRFTALGVQRCSVSAFHMFSVSAFGSWGWVLGCVWEVLDEARSSNSGTLWPAEASATCHQDVHVLRYLPVSHLRRRISRKIFIFRHPVGANTIVLVSARICLKSTDPLT